MDGPFQYLRTEDKCVTKVSCVTKVHEPYTVKKSLVALRTAKTRFMPSRGTHGTFGAHRGYMGTALFVDFMLILWGSLRHYFSAFKVVSWYSVSAPFPLVSRLVEKLGMLCQFHVGGSSRGLGQPFAL